MIFLDFNHIFIIIRSIFMFVEHLFLSKMNCSIPIYLILWIKNENGYTLAFGD